MNLITKSLIGAGSILLSTVASSTIITSTSPTGFDVTTVGATTIGGIVTDLVGVNGAHVVSQVSANALFEGFAYENPLTIGSQSGFTSAVTNSLGGGLLSASFRFTLWDGDSAAGDFDYNDNTLLINGLDLGNWSSVDTVNTNSLGHATPVSSSGGGFRDNLLDTGWFTSVDSLKLSSLYASMVLSESILFQLKDSDYGENYFDFTQGLDSSLINVGQAPVVGGVVPEPSTIAIFALGVMGLISRRSLFVNKKQ